MRTMDRPAAIAQSVLPIGGPYDPDSVIDAGRTVSELVRNLNHATRHPEAFEYPSHIDSLVGSLQGAVLGLGQLFVQVISRLEQFAEDPTLYDDRGGDPPYETREAVLALYDANVHAARLEAALSAAGSALNRLGAAATQHRPHHSGYAEASRVVEQADIKAALDAAAATVQEGRGR